MNTTIPCICGGCNQEIEPDQVLFQCNCCINYYTCINCQVLGVASGTHLSSHPHEVIRSHELPRGPHTPPPYPSSPLPNHSPNATPPQTAEQYWGTLVTPEKTPSPMFLALINAIFNHFDNTIKPTRTGWLEPEKYSAILHAMGARDIDVFSHGKGYTMHRPELNLPAGDILVSAYFMQNCIDHKMTTRPTSHTIDENSWPVVENGMPLLSRRGLVAVLMSQAIGEPDYSAAAFNYILYNVRLINPDTGTCFQGFGIPRSCFPATPDQNEQRRIQFATEQYKRFVEFFETQVRMVKLREEEQERGGGRGRVNSGAAKMMAQQPGLNTLGWNVRNRMSVKHDGGVKRIYTY